jgi:dolichol-phosphate mannosyltransferase
VDPQIVIVVPVFNESGNIGPLVREVVRAFAPETRPWQLVLVDDASTDDTWEVIRRNLALEPRLAAFRHRRNRGQSAAVWTGISRTSAPLLCTLDGDLQNDPGDLPGMLALLEEVDFVCGHRVQRQDTLLRKVSSQVARKVRSTVLRWDFADTGCALRAFKRSSLVGVFPFNGLHRFLPILVAAWTWPGRQRTGWGDVVLVAAVVAGTVLSLFEQRAYPMLRGWTAERVQVLGDTLYVEPHAADVLSLLRAQVDAHARDGQSFLAAPYWPGAYAVERRRSPVWEIYQLFPATEERQRREIARLREADIGFSMFSLFRADARPDLGFVSTHPLIVAYLDRCMKLLPPSPSTEGRDIRIHVAGDPGCTID